MQKQGKLHAKKVTKNVSVRNHNGKDSGRRSEDPSAIDRLEVKRQLDIRRLKINEAFSFARLVLISGVIVSLTVVLLLKDTNLFLEVLKILGGGGIGYGVGKHLTR